MLWIKGPAGQGKTILTKFLLGHLESSTFAHSNTAVIYFFFHGQDNSLCTIGAALRALVKQLLSFQHVNGFDVISVLVHPELSTLEEDILWEMLKRLLESALFDRVYCLVDGLDECRDPASRLAFLRYFQRLHQPRRTGSRQHRASVLKTIFTGRPTVELDRQLSSTPTIHLKADPQDLETFICSEIDFLGFDGEMRTNAVQLLVRRAEQTFLWISILIKKLRHEALLSVADLERIVDSSPTSLTELYNSIVTDIMDHSSLAQQKLLVWAVYGQQTLTLLELQHAIAVHDDSDCIESTRKHMVHLTKQSVTSAVGIILDIGEDDRLHLIHQSVKDFLLGSSHLSDAEFCQGLKPSAYLAKTCLIYLGFTDFRVMTNHKCLPGSSQPGGFLKYAAKYWFRHIRDDQDMRSLAGLIFRITEPRSANLSTWAQATGLLNLEEAESRWEVATLANILWLAEFDLVMLDSILDARKVQNAISRGKRGYEFLEQLVQRPNVQINQAAIHAIIRSFDRRMAYLLIVHQGAVLDSDVAGAIAENIIHGESILRLFLDHKDARSVTATLELVHGLASKPERYVSHPGLDVYTIPADGSDDYSYSYAPRLRRIISLLIRSENVELTDAATATIFKMFRRHPPDIEHWIEIRKSGIVTDHVVQIVLDGLADIHLSVLCTVFTHFRGQIEISSNQVREMRRHAHCESLFRTLVQDYEAKLVLNEDFVGSIFSTLGEQQAAFLLEAQGEKFKITEQIAQRVAEFGEHETMELLLDSRGTEFSVTEKVFECAVRNGMEMASLLLRRRGAEFKITNTILQVVAASGNCEIMDLLLTARGQEVRITENIIKHVAAAHDGLSMLQLLCKRRRQEVVVTEAIMVEVIRKKNRHLLYYVLDTFGRSISVTDNMLLAAATEGEDTLETVLDAIFWRFPESLRLVITVDFLLRPEFGICPELEEQLMKEWVLLTGLRTAVDAGDRRTLVHLLSEGVIPNTRDFHGDTLISHAAKCGLADMVDVLAQSGHFDIDPPNSYNWTPLYKAYDKGVTNAIEPPQVSCLLRDSVQGVLEESRGLIGGHDERSEIGEDGGDPKSKDEGSNNPSSAAEIRWHNKSGQLSSPSTEGYDFYDL